MADRGSRQRGAAEVVLLGVPSPAVHRLAAALRERDLVIRLLDSQNQAALALTGEGESVLVIGEHQLPPRPGILRLGVAPSPGEAGIVVDELACGSKAVRSLAGLQVSAIVACGLPLAVQRGVQITAAALGVTLVATPEQAARGAVVGLLCDAASGPPPVPRARQLPLQIERRLPVPAPTPGWPRLEVTSEDLAAACCAAIAAQRAGQPPTLQRLPPAGPQPAMPGAVDDERLQAALDWIAAHAAEHIGVTDIAAAAGVSSRSLQRLFTSELGCTPWNEVLRQRVEAARVLLAGSDTSLGEIARQVGFTEADRLSAAFRRFVGCTPGRWRALRRS